MIPEVIKDLTDLDDLYQEMLKAQTPRARNQFKWLLRAATNRNRDSMDLTVRKKLAKHWLNHYKYSLVSKESSDFLLADLDTCIAQLLAPQVLPSLIKQPGYAQLIASACMLRVAYTDMEYGNLPSNDLHIVLSNIGNQKVDHSILESVPKIVEYFYGPAAWGLYSIDVPEKTELPAYLWSLNLPLTGIENHVALPRATNTSLPFDLT